MLSDLKQAGWAADTGWVGGAAGSMVCVCMFRAWERGVYETPGVLHFPLPLDPADPSAPHGPRLDIHRPGLHSNQL